MDDFTLRDLPASERLTAGDDPARAGRWISTRQYQTLYGFNIKTIRKACRDGRLKYKIDGKRIYVWDPAQVFTGADPLENVPFIKMDEIAKLLNLTRRCVTYYAQHNIIKTVWIGGRRYTTIQEFRKLIARRANNRGAGRKKHTRESVIDFVREKLREKP